MSDLLKIAVVGHSLIHPRQYLFWDYVNSLDDVEVLQIYPDVWGGQKRKGGYDMGGGGEFRNINMTNYVFNSKVVNTLKEFNPDVLYSNTEPWQAQSHRSRRWATELGCKLAYFFWENLQVVYDGITHEADLIVCGNKECEDLVKLHDTDTKDTIVLPQVGIMTDRFKVMKNPYRTMEVLFAFNPTIV